LSPGAPLLAAAGKFVHMKLTGARPASKMNLPQQVFALLTKEGYTGAGPAPSAAFVMTSAAADAAPSAGSSMTYTLRLEVGSVEVTEALAGPGTYSVRLLVGDALAAKPLSWSVGSVTLQLPTTTAAAAAAAGGASASSSATVDPFVVPPEIQHSFRPSDERSFPLVSTVFTALACVPLLVLVGLLLREPMRWRWPATGDHVTYTAAFQICLLAILLLYVLYWLSLNIFQAMAALSVLSLGALVSGRGALRSSSRLRDQQREEKKQ